MLPEDWQVLEAVESVRSAACVAARLDEAPIEGATADDLTRYEWAMLSNHL
jgi:hypothetical protein